MSLCLCGGTCRIQEEDMLPADISLTLASALGSLYCSAAVVIAHLPIGGELRRFRPSVNANPFWDAMRYRSPIPDLLEGDSIRQGMLTALSCSCL